MQPRFETLFVPYQADKLFSKGIFTLNEFVEKTFQEAVGKMEGEKGQV